MTGRSSAKPTGLCLLALLLFCICKRDVMVAAQIGPIPSELLYDSEAFLKNTENYIMLNKLRQMEEEKKDIDERKKELDVMEEYIIESFEARKDKAAPRVPPAGYSPEELPTPNAVVRELQRAGKRTELTYMTLCHFKICNMGRKRQLHK
ncbi:uncharacterized protein LOC117229959 [Megalopta genalis]|uniref:uncharacterized protein LOC117229959 n=1 Tax=Megalopta genalis TaxID=115081 RepID=UPI0014436D3D|nr:uncharacterized protein LOC117229959 [Megalopta genalis]XP_033342819.1 uncharacterized protein LOC117229959 [Megalopta genalis]